MRLRFYRYRASQKSKRFLMQMGGVRGKRTVDLAVRYAFFYGEGEAWRRRLRLVVRRLNQHASFRSIGIPQPENPTEIVSPKHTWLTFRQNRFPAAGPFYHNNPQRFVDMSIKLRVRRSLACYRRAIADFVMTVEAVNGGCSRALCYEVCALATVVVLVHFSGLAWGCF